MRDRLARIGERLLLNHLALPIGVGLALTLFLISELGYHRSRGGLAESADVARSRLQTMVIVRRLTEAESATRGFLLTDRELYLAPYRNALDEVARAQNQLRDSIQAGRLPEVAASHREFARLVGEKVSELETVLALAQQGKHQAALDLVMSDIGREMMLSVHREADTMLGLQNAWLVSMIDDVHTVLLVSRIGIATMAGLSLALLALFLSQARATALVKLQQAEALRAERDRLEQQVSLRTAELTELTGHLQTVQEDEKARLARELHDELGALLTAAKLDVARIKPTLNSVAPELAPRLAHLIETLNQGIALKRRIIEDLRPSTLDNLGLRPALEVLCEESSQRLGIPVLLEAKDIRISPSGDLTVYRLVQEALNNAAKYAKATGITVSLKACDDQVVVEVVDDGVGFDPGHVRRGAQGLVGMRYRVAAENGTLQISSRPREGARLRASIPAVKPERAT